jgi:hypothetical protein
MDILIQILLYAIISTVIAIYAYKWCYKKYNLKSSGIVKNVFFIVFIFFIPQSFLSTFLSALQRYVGRENFNDYFLIGLTSLIQITVVILVYKLVKRIK